MKKLLLSIVIIILILFCCGGILFLGYQIYKNSADVSSPIKLPTRKHTPVIEEDNKSKEAKVIYDKEKKLPIEEYDKKIYTKVPFTSQAPSAQWSIQIYQDGCEEASIIMGMRWVEDEDSLSKKQAEEEIKALSDFAMEKYGFNLDLSGEDTGRLIKDYYGHERVAVVNDITTEDIVNALYDNALVIVPVNGKKLFNPYFTGGGPDNHMLIIIGYDPKKEIFTTNDPGTRRGKDYKYSRKIMENALRDYPSGFHEPNPEVKKVMIVLKR